MNVVDAALPLPRQDLSLLPDEPEADGNPAWLLHDPLSNRFYRISDLDLSLLGHLAAGTPEQVAAAVSAQRGEPVEPAQVEDLVDFLRGHNLVRYDAQQANWYQQQNTARLGWRQRLAHGWLFMRYPLWRPDAFLTRTLPMVRWLGTRAAAFGLALLAMFGLWLVAREPDSFLGSFQHFFNLQGLIWYGVALLGVKFVHELGHAYVAKAHGCKVPVIGVGLMVFFPVFYTDTTDVWRLGKRRGRLAVTAAGMLTELGVASVSLLAWSLAPEGPLKSALFLLATTTWALSLLVNLNPLMRFDGYFLLSDLLRVPNLEQRSFALARWWLRERLFAWNDAPPERPRPLLIGFAFAVWVYRFLLFLGIALLVYHFLFKLAGIALFALEMAYLIVRPVWNEAKHWLGRRSEIRWNRATARTSLLLVLLLTALIWPWQQAIEAPAVLSARYTPVYMPVSGRLQRLAVQRGSEVGQGEVMAVIASPGLEHDLAMTRLRHADLQQQRASMGFSERQQARSLVVASELLTQARRVASLEQRLARLTLASPHAGVVTDLSSALKEGDWLSEGDKLFGLLDPGDSRFTAYVTEDNALRIQPGANVRFYDEAGALSPISAVVQAIEPMGLRQLPSPYAASSFGGGVAVRESAHGELTPVSGTYEVHLQLLNDADRPQRITRGVAVIEGEAEGLLARVWRRMQILMNRELAF